MKNRILICYILLILFVFTGCFKDPERLPNAPRQNYEKLWEIIDTRYCYLDYKEIDWDAIYKKYENATVNAKSDNDLFNVFAAMLNELKDGHVNLYSPFNTSRYWDWYTDYPANFDREVIFSEHYLGDNYLMAGGMCYKKITPTVGYIYYGSFSNAVSDATMAYIFEYFKKCNGIIIDVRNNGGGSLSYSELLASYFFQEETLTGYIAHKTGPGHSDFSELTEVVTKPHYSLRWDKKVVVLTNRMSYSATNDFVCRMKSCPTAAIVGDKTGGGGGMPLSSELPNGWSVRFSACPMFDTDKQHTEWGIDPDYKAKKIEDSPF
ncbi:S41 family peptidase, partial [Bacteroidales bacterium OttesenSCG-928-B11]|nr:S41 family peptidase [Bacteroidales bacterium OttesenSCG-928-E04]MDL2313160.1 S41 family peptidase [Bacteroidales bacterium OttesenSCG-928-B11]